MYVESGNIKPETVPPGVIRIAILDSKITERLSTNIPTLIPLPLLVLCIVVPLSYFPIFKSFSTLQGASFAVYHYLVMSLFLEVGGGGNDLIVVLLSTSRRKMSYWHPGIRIDPDIITCHH